MAPTLRGKDNAGDFKKTYMDKRQKETFQRVYQVVRCIPPGKVATYGQIAQWLGWPHGARTVGWALRALVPGTGVPWHRVINAKGKISIASETLQRELLEAEGVAFNAAGRIDLNTYRYTGPVLIQED